MTAVREATVADLPDVLNVVDGAALRVDVDSLRERIASGDVLVAVEEGRVLGTLVLDGDRIAAVAVRRGRRDQGIGTALVEAAADRRDRLVAEFDARVRPFWESLGFDIEPADEPDRYRGVLRAGTG
ncbi:GNAT family N-acetyltransferase [Salinirussus salinus]|uniref:GNAT family N-acetyltransferase n=1 Tax=Salinirussus salinus TaxID=1198300 RepID=UPI0013584407|nr:GNAT family N-acetyltransferase [Salinirussus salinus]